MTRRVVVTGLGMVSPLGNDLETSWKAALRGESGVGIGRRERRERQAGA